MENLNTQIAELLNAVRRSDVPKVKQLLAANVSPTQCDANGQTALMVASQKRDLQLLQLLCLASTNRSSPAQLFFCRDTASPVSVLPTLTQTNETSSLETSSLTALTPETDSSENYLPLPFDAGLPVANGKVADTLQSSPRSEKREPNIQSLELAVRHNDLESVKSLLKAKVSFRPVNWYDTPLLVVAAEKGYGEIVQAFIDAGANVHIGYDQLPLHAAAANGHLEVAQRLLNSGADVHATNEGGRTALMEAAAAGHFLLVELLIVRGSNVNASCRGETALMLAAQKRHRPVYELLYPYVHPAGRIPFPESISNAFQLSL